MTTRGLISTLILLQVHLQAVSRTDLKQNFLDDTTDMHYCIFQQGSTSSCLRWKHRKLSVYRIFLFDMVHLAYWLQVAVNQHFRSYCFFCSFSNILDAFHDIGLLTLDREIFVAAILSKAVLKT